MPESFNERTLWPEFNALSTELQTHLAEVTERIIRSAIDGDVSEAEESDGPKLLSG